MGKNNKPYTIEYVKNQFENRNYTLLSKDYKNQDTKLDFVCNKHKEVGVQNVTFRSFLRNKCNCCICKSESKSKTWHECRNFTPITADEFYVKHFEKYKQKLFEEVGTEYDLINIFKKDNKTYMKLKHNVCNTIYDIESYNFFSIGQRCPNKECNSKIRSQARMKPISKLKEEIFELVGDEYELVSEYNGTNKNATFYHKVCKNTFQKTLCEDLVDTYECLDEDNMGVSVVAKYEETKEIISCLCLFDYDINSIEVSPVECNGYSDEYLITLLDGEINCEKNKINDRYLHTESEYTYVFDDCNSNCLRYIHSDKLYEVSILDEDEEDFELEDEFEDDCNCAVSVDSDGDMHGFTLQKSSEDGYSSISFYSTEKLCACELEHLMDVFMI